MGNDFLPHLPLLEIRELGGIGKLFQYYKAMLPKCGGFLTQSGGKANLKRVGVLLKQLGDIEDGVFKKRTESDASWKRKNEARAYNGEFLDECELDDAINAVNLGRAQAGVPRVLRRV